MKLRPYQEKVKEAVYEGWDIANPGQSKARRVLIQVPTGGGKTVIFNNIAQDFLSMGEDVLIVAHRQELIYQADDKFRRANPDHKASDIIMGGMDRLFWPSLKIGSIQTISRRIGGQGGKDRLKFRRAPKLIVIDEAHHATAKTYQKLIDNFPESLILGVTATPCKMDGSGFEEIFEKLILGPAVADLETMWFEAPGKDRGLVPDTVYHIQLNSEVRKVKKVRGDFDAKALNGILNSDAACQAIVDSWKEAARGQKTIAFCVKNAKGYDEAHNLRLARVFNENGIPAACITGETPDPERKRLLREFEQGKYTVLTNCEIFTEGFDLPGIECTILARPTMSLSLYLQMVGRGKRPAGVEKKAHILLDYVGNVLAHGPPNERHKWTLEGVKKPNPEKGGFERKVMIQGQLFKPQEVPPTYEGPLHYQVVEIPKDFRLHYYEKARVEAENYTSPIAARYRAYAAFLRKVDCQPTYEELEIIGEQISRNPKGWAHIQNKKFTTFQESYQAAQTTLDYQNLMVWVNAEFQYQDKYGNKRQSPGYKALSQKIKRALKAKESNRKKPLL